MASATPKSRRARGVKTSGLVCGRRMMRCPNPASTIPLATPRISTSTSASRAAAIVSAAPAAAQAASNVVSMRAPRLRTQTRSRAAS